MMERHKASKPFWLIRILDWLKTIDEPVSLNESELLFQRVEALEQEIKELKAQRVSPTADPPGRL
jgi:hypothetical protein